MHELVHTTTYLCNIYNYKVLFLLLLLNEIVACNEYLFRVVLGELEKMQ